MLIVRWSDEALFGFQEPIDYIERDSLQNAIKVEEDILEITDSLKNNPERFGLDKYIRNNDGSFRYFEKHRLRISFRVTDKEVVIFKVQAY